MTSFIKKIILFLLIINIFVPSVFAIDEQGQKPLTLDECIQKALSNSPELKKAKVTYEMAKKNVKIAQSVYFPTLNAGVGYNFSNRTGSEINTTNGNAFNVNAGIKQLIWDFGKSTANINMQKFNKIVAAYNFDTKVIDTIFDVKINYYTTLASKAAIEVDKSNVQINERGYQRTNAYFEEGLKSKIDLVNAEVNVTDAKVSLLSSENLYKNSLANLNNSMYLAYAPVYNIEVPAQFSSVHDITPKSLTELEKPVDDLIAPPKGLENALYSAQVETRNFNTLYKFDKFPYTFEECLDIANKNRPDIKAYSNTIKAMEQSLKVIKRQYFPELSASGSYGFNGANTNNHGNTTNSFGVGVNLSSAVNIMSEKYQIDNAKLQIDLAQHQLDLLKQDVYFDVQRAYINMIEFEEQIPLLEQKISQTLENLELADGRYAVGLGDYIQLQDAKVNYNKAQHAFVRAVFSYNVAKAKLEQAIAAEQKVTVTLED